MNFVRGIFGLSDFLIYYDQYIATFVSEVFKYLNRFILFGAIVLANMLV